ncbi:TPA: antirestriction protein ArdA [Escherichia coli]
MKTKTSAPAVYVGTWAKYNNGSIEGCWFNDLTVFETESDFLSAARKFHQDEKDPEFMYAKWHLNRSQFGIRIDHDLASISDHSLASQSITIWHASDH